MNHRSWDQLCPFRLRGGAACVAGRLGPSRGERNSQLKQSCLSWDQHTDRRRPNLLFGHSLPAHQHHTLHPWRVTTPSCCACRQTMAPPPPPFHSRLRARRLPTSRRLPGRRPCSSSVRPRSSQSSSAVPCLLAMAPRLPSASGCRQKRGTEVGPRAQSLTQATSNWPHRPLRRRQATRRRSPSHRSCAGSTAARAWRAWVALCGARPSATHSSSASPPWWTFRLAPAHQCARVPPAPA